jgi:transcriptional regulator with XRE-family HTH domain
MMTARELLDDLSHLNLSLSEAAQLLGVSERSVRRWTEGESVPGPVEAVLRAWRQLQARNLPWKPDSVSVFQDDDDQLRRIRNYDELLHQLILEVDAQGGPANPWAVDLTKERATFGPAEVSFHRLENGGFSPSTYRRLDRTPSDKDTTDIQDACYCIAQAFSLARQTNAALVDIAEYTRAHAGTFAQDGAASLSPLEAERRTAKIATLADELNLLATSALDGKALYGRFETILRSLHHLGFFPDMELVSAVARTMVNLPATRT